jgi:hypothetical protein
MKLPESVGSESSQVPRFHAAATPISVPMTNARMVTVPTSTSVYGSARPTRSPTGCG